MTTLSAALFRCSVCGGFVDAFAGTDQYACSEDHMVCGSCPVVKKGDVCRVCGQAIGLVTSLSAASAVRSGAYHLRRAIKGCRNTKTCTYRTLDERDARLHELVSCRRVGEKAVVIVTGRRPVSDDASDEQFSLRGGGIVFDMRKGTLHMEAEDGVMPVYVYVCTARFTGYGVFDPAMKKKKAEQLDAKLLQLGAGDSVVMCVYAVFRRWGADPGTWDRTHDGSVCRQTVGRWRETWHFAAAAEGVALGPGKVPGPLHGGDCPVQPVQDGEALRLYAGRLLKDVNTKAAVFEVCEGQASGVNRFLFAVVDVGMGTSTALLCPGCLRLHGTLDEFAQHVDLPPQLLLMARPVGEGDEGGECVRVRCGVGRMLVPRVERERVELMPPVVFEATRRGVEVYGWHDTERGLLNGVYLESIRGQWTTVCVHCGERDGQPSMARVWAHNGMRAEQEFGRVVVPVDNMMPQQYSIRPDVGRLSCVLSGAFE